MPRQNSEFALSAFINNLACVDPCCGRKRGIAAFIVHTVRLPVRRFRRRDFDKDEWPSACGLCSSSWLQVSRHR